MSTALTVPDSISPVLSRGSIVLVPEWGCTTICTPVAWVTTLASPLATA